MTILTMPGSSSFIVLLNKANIMQTNTSRIKVKSSKPRKAYTEQQPKQGRKPERIVFYWES